MLTTTKTHQETEQRIKKNLCHLLYSVVVHGATVLLNVVLITATAIRAVTATTVSVFVLSMLPESGFLGLKDLQDEVVLMIDEDLR
jgi:hypothetical protein